MKITHIENTNQYQFAFGTNAEVFSVLMQNKEIFEKVLAANGMQATYDENTKQITISKKVAGENTELYFPEFLPVIAAIANLTNQPISSLLEDDSLFQQSLSHLSIAHNELLATPLTSRYEYTTGRYKDFPHRNVPDVIQHTDPKHPYNCNEMKITVKHPVSGKIHTLESKFIAGEGPEWQSNATQLMSLIKENDIEHIVVLGPAVEGGKSKHYPYYKNEPFKKINSTEKVVVYQAETDAITAYHFDKIEDMGTFKISKSTSTSADIVGGLASIAKTEPVFIHCSAGLGRTGTFILAMLLRNHMDLFANLDVDQKFDLISQIWDQMNSQRPGMIQSKDQFINALSIADILTGKTDFFNEPDLLKKFFPTDDMPGIMIMRHNSDHTEVKLVREGFSIDNSYVRQSKQVLTEINNLEFLIRRLTILIPPIVNKADSSQSTPSRSFSAAEIEFNKMLSLDIPELKIKMAGMLTIAPEFLPQNTVSNSNNSTSIAYSIGQTQFAPPAQNPDGNNNNQTAEQFVDGRHIVFNYQFQ